MARNRAECARIEELLSAAQDGAATPEERARIARHLVGCADCRASQAAFRRIDDRVRRYLSLTPVPEIARPWRDARPARPAPPFAGGRWRAALAGLATLVLLLAGVALLTGRAPGGRDAPPGQESSGQRAPMAAGQPTAAAAVADSARTTSGGATTAAAGALAAATGAAPASGAAQAAPTTARAGAPAAASGATSAAVNPARRYDLAAATALTICPPGDGACQAEPLPPERREALVRALDRDLARSPQAPAPTPGGPAATLAFDLPDGRRVAIAYDHAAGLLLLPGGDGAVVAPPELAAALPAAPTPPR